MTRVVGTAVLLVMSATGVVRARDASVAGWLRRLVRPLFAEASVELVVPLIRDRIGYSGSSGEVVTIFRPAPVAGAGALRLGCVSE